MGIDSPQPRLSWVLASSERGQRQTAWQILVSSSPESLENDKGDVWDSGKVPSDQTAGIGCGGGTLLSSQTVVMKVRAWDRDGQPTPWSADATWTMGLLAPADWKAKWISALCKGQYGVAPCLRARVVWFALG